MLVDTYMHQREKCAHAALPNDFMSVLFLMFHVLNIAEYSPPRSLENKR